MILFGCRYIMKQAAFVLAGATVSLGVVARAQARVQGASADAFVDSMGINVHMESSTPPYSLYGKINPILQALGMRHFRDEINDTDRSFVSEMHAIGKLGYTLTGLIEGGGDYPTSGRIQAGEVVPMIEDLRPTIDAVEGPNEPDNRTFVYNGSHFPLGAIDEAEDLWKIVKGTRELADLPIVGMSEANAQDFTQLASVTPAPIAYANYGNLHAYQGGQLGDNQLASWYIPYARFLTGCGPVWTTEMGYHNYTQYLSDGEQQGVSEGAAAIYLPIAFFSGFNRGVMRTFAYELIDEAADFNAASGEGHYGLVRYNGSAKPGFTALKNVIDLLEEPGDRPFQAGSLEITFAGAPDTMHSTLLEKSTGEFYLALWNDVSVYQTAAPGAPGKDLYPASVPVTVRLSAPHGFTVYAPNDASGTNPTGAYTLSTTPSSIRIDLPAKVLLVRIAGAT
jgi:hypothetical protein